jgi:galactokinase
VGIAYLLALETANGLEVGPEENIQYDRYVENVYLGLKNGILDQSIILMSDRDHLTFLDCQSLQFAKYPTPMDNGQFEVVVVHSGVAESLASTEYNSRVEECQRAACALLELAGESVPERPKLRLIAESAFERYGDLLPEPLNRRARHFFTENRRVREGIGAWVAGDLAKFGSLINASGASSVQDYESGCPELITLYEILRDCPGVYGARFSGGGFRGSCIGLVNPAYRDRIVDVVRSCYPRAHPQIEDLYSIHFCRLDGPARLWTADEQRRDLSPEELALDVLEPVPA